jgi:hypothetical protein
MNHLPQQAFSTSLRLDFGERLTLERRLLSQMMVDPKLTTARAMLTADCFLDPLHGHIWEAMVALENQMQPRSGHLVVGKLERCGIEWNKRQWLQIIRQPIEYCEYVSTHFETFTLQLRTWADDVAEYRAAVAVMERMAK